MWQYHEDYETNRPIDAYISKHYKSVLRISGLYLKMDRRNRFLSIFQVVIYVLTLLYQIAIFINSTIIIYGFNMTLFSLNAHLALLMQVSLIVLLSVFWNNFKVFIIHKLLSDDVYDYQEPPVAGEELLRSKMKAELSKLILIPIGVALAAGVILSVSPIIDFKAGTFDFNSTAWMFDYHLPYPYSKCPYNVTDGSGYYFAMLEQVACGFVLSAIIGGGGFLFINTSENLCLQLMILGNSLDNIESRIEHLHAKLFGTMDGDSMESIQHDKRYAYCYNQCLRKNFEHHQVILKVFKLLEDIFSIPVGCAYLTGTLVIALSMVSAGSAKELPGTTAASILMCAVEVGYMFLFSVMGQRINDLSAELRYKIYNTKWYICSKEVKSTLMIFQEMTLKPMTMTVGKIVPANMETFTTVMNAAYSYYNLVYAVDKK
nr:odorant receptor 11 [Graphosoma rubrolineatum]